MPDEKKTPPTPEELQRWRKGAADFIRRFADTLEQHDVGIITAGLERETTTLPDGTRWPGPGLAFYVSITRGDTSFKPTHHRHWEEITERFQAAALEFEDAVRAFGRALPAPIGPAPEPDRD